MLFDPAAERPAAPGHAARDGDLRSATAVARGPGRGTAAFARLEAAAQAELLRLASALPPAALPADPLLCEVCWDLGVDGTRVMELGRHARTPRT